jgi:hypothetical protein
VKLRQNGIVSLMINPAVFLAGRGAYMKLHLKSWSCFLSWATLHFVGWVEPTPGFVGFRCTQPNLHVAGVIAKCET